MHPRLRGSRPQRGGLDVGGACAGNDGEGAARVVGGRATATARHRSLAGALAHAAKCKGCALLQACCHSAPCTWSDMLIACRCERVGVAMKGQGVITAVSSAHIYSCVHVQVQAGAGTQWQASEALHHPLKVRHSLEPVQVNSTGMITKLADYSACTVSLKCVGSFV